ncbi:hypothetical protein [Lysinibacillus fusiformis]|uniref:Uncharacterized protein n=1 Tax=Lysinibacillus fusiformis TaxID=28031 RepID=A0A1H9AXF8_9BACI|nr:hypothetical protein [Lysinibacillus fusiformis]SCX81853.1 hypothetical protein SAMN02787081_00125 [Lysinibacillus fusiformis]SEM76437.1 hypothetical protein SAMN02787103_00125 [Lysinibacillus fusiformis]SEP81299.1 hypothetical protein SAMN02787113_00633 [Lysinibacillus fusiformis]
MRSKKKTSKLIINENKNLILKCFSKKSLIVFIISLLLIPIAINYLTLLDLSIINDFFNKDIINVSGTNSEWVTFFATYLGAIIGGIISGSITLIGVIYTINSQKEHSTVENYAKIRYKADHTNELYLAALRRIKLLHSAKSKAEFEDIWTSIISDFDKAMNSASEVNIDFYISFLDLRHQIHQFNKEIISIQTKNYYDMEDYKYFLKSERFSFITKLISQEHSALDVEYIKVLKDYQNLFKS